MRPPGVIFEFRIENQDQLTFQLVALRVPDQAEFVAVGVGHYGPSDSVLAALREPGSAQIHDPLNGRLEVCDIQVDVGPVFMFVPLGHLLKQQSGLVVT